MATDFVAHHLLGERTEEGKLLFLLTFQLGVNCEVTWRLVVNAKSELDDECKLLRNFFFFFFFLIR